VLLQNRQDLAVGKSRLLHVSLLNAISVKVSTQNLDYFSGGLQCFVSRFNIHKAASISITLYPVATGSLSLRAITNRTIAVTIAFRWICCHSNSP
jgi:hypothetical protein